MNDLAILIGSDQLGSGDAKLGRLLLGNFLRILGDRQKLPAYIVLWNAGVKAASAGAGTVDFLKHLEERGVEIVLCRTCVEYFGLEHGIVVGRIDGMAAIQDILLAHQVVTV